MDAWDAALLLIVAIVGYILGWKFPPWPKTTSISLDSYNCAARQATITISGDLPHTVCAYAYDNSGGTATGNAPHEGSTDVQPGSLGQMTMNVPHENNVSDDVRVVIWSVNRHVQSNECPTTTTTSTTTSTTSTTSTTTTPAPP